MYPPEFLVTIAADKESSLNSWLLSQTTSAGLRAAQHTIIDGRLALENMITLFF